MKTSPFANHPGVNWKMEDAYKSFLTLEEYEWLLHLSLEQVSQSGEIISANSSGIKAIIPEYDTDIVLELPLLTLFRNCKKADRSQWQSMITWHFRKFPPDLPHSEFLKKDWSYAEDHLRILIKPIEACKKVDDSCIRRIDFPGTYSFLVLDADDFMSYVRRDQIDWEASDDDDILFQVALNNIAREKMHVQDLYLGTAFSYFGFFNANFAPAFLIELKRNAAFTLGEFGAVVAIPSIEVAFSYPINDLNVLNFPNAIRPLIDDMFVKGQLSITKTLYWYYKGRYEAFPVQMQHGKPVFSLPVRLMNLLVNLS